MFTIHFFVLFLGGLLAGAIFLGTVQGNNKKDHFYEL